jgi:hypothetical protein
MRDPDYEPTTNVEDIYARWDALVPPELAERLEEWVTTLVERAPSASLALALHARTRLHAHAHACTHAHLCTRC